MSLTFKFEVNDGQYRLVRSEPHLGQSVFFAAFVYGAGSTDDARDAEVVASPAEAREFAKALLLAADVAEQQPEDEE